MLRHMLPYSVNLIKTCYLLFYQYPLTLITTNPDTFEDIHYFPHELDYGCHIWMAIHCSAIMFTYVYEEVHFYYNSMMINY